jgi:hypothetical protein
MGSVPPSLAEIILRKVDLLKGWMVVVFHLSMNRIATNFI